MSEIRITLVHGTGARTASWCRPDGSLANELRRRIPGGVVIDRVEWTGANSFAARFAGAKTLAEHLRANPDRRRHFVVAHSHGGSVAIYCMKRNHTLMESIGGVCTLATPLFHIRPRPLAEVLATALSITLLLVGFVAIGMGATDALVRHKLLAFESPWFVAPAGAAVLMLAISLWRVVPKLRRVPTWIEHKYKVLQDYETGTVPAGNWCFLRGVGDEVGLFLGAVQLVSRLGTTILGMVSFVTDRFYRLFGRLTKPVLGKVLLLFVLTYLTVNVVALGLAFINPFAGLLEYANPLDPRNALAIGQAAIGEQISGWLDFGFVVVLDIAIVVGGAFVTTFIFGVLLSFLALLAFGLSAPRLGLLFEFAVEQVPVGIHDARMIDWPRGSQPLLSLEHSVWSSSAAAEAIANWINASIAKYAAPEH